MCFAKSQISLPTPNAIPSPSLLFLHIFILLLLGILSLITTPQHLKLLPHKRKRHQTSIFQSQTLRALFYISCRGGEFCPSFFRLEGVERDAEEDGVDVFGYWSCCGVGFGGVERIGGKALWIALVEGEEEVGFDRGE
jgi:hypothetical protein